MKQFCLTIYHTKGEPQDDLRCAICHSMEDVNRFRQENDDIKIIQVIEEDNYLGENLKEAVERLIATGKIQAEDKQILNAILKGGFFIGRKHSYGYEREGL